ncbi:hypothetical protein RFI_12801 [Reticulomyxa filosa]|uniref:Uncharacterized protein n=1 Tax=Reticulomyxa filosa TaxID=46433 RepID=X6NG96_RETFI|nr:hypothetical protein RFI_12801 [Reticulomyxa filosa]|eukprot:ETO24357.1 hypothetical protein RFI_12801 [Reticulomyxa filosa]
MKNGSCCFLLLRLRSCAQSQKRKECSECGTKYRSKDIKENACINSIIKKFHTLSAAVGRASVLFKMDAHNNKNASIYNSQTYEQVLDYYNNHDNDENMREAHENNDVENEENKQNIKEREKEKEDEKLFDEDNSSNNNPFPNEPFKKRRLKRTISSQSSSGSSISGEVWYSTYKKRYTNSFVDKRENLYTNI